PTAAGDGLVRVAHRSPAASWQRARHPEADVLDREGRVAAPPHTGATAPLPVAPAAAQHPVLAVDLGVVALEAPLPHVAEHVVQTPGVGRLAADRPDPVTGVVGVPGDLVERCVPRPGGPGPAGVLPLRL